MGLANRFDECIDIGNKGEKIVSDNKNVIFDEQDENVIKKLKKSFNPILKRIIYGENEASTQLQRDGVDGLLYSTEITIPYDVKTRRYQYYKLKDILLETYSDVFTNKKGWLYTSKSDIIVYVWFDDTERFFVDGYILYMDIVRKWIIGHEYEFKTIRAPNYGWMTEGILVLISHFPNNSIRKIDNEIFKLDDTGQLRSCFV